MRDRGESVGHFTAVAQWEAYIRLVGHDYDDDDDTTVSTGLTVSGLAASDPP